MRAEEQVGRIHAQAIVTAGAVVADEQSVRNWAEVNDVGQAVGANLLTTLAAGAKLPVPIALLPGPQPA